MNTSEFVIRPIRLDQWLPDRCLGSGRPFDPDAHPPEAGCSSLDWFHTHGSREKLEAIYRQAIKDDGGCGFVTWHDDKVIAYHTFFSRKIAQKIKFFGWGSQEDTHEKTLVHNCLTMVKGSYLRKGVCSNLVKHSLKWAKESGWSRFEVHLVLPDCEEGWNSEQKTCSPFWEKLGFEIYRTEEADEETRKTFPVDRRFSMYLTLQRRSTQPTDAPDKK